MFAAKGSERNSPRVMTRTYIVDTIDTLLFPGRKVWRAFSGMIRMFDQRVLATRHPRDPLTIVVLVRVRFLSFVIEHWCILALADAFRDLNFSLQIAVVQIEGRHLCNDVPAAVLLATNGGRIFPILQRHCSCRSRRNTSTNS